MDHIVTGDRVRESLVLLDRRRSDLHTRSGDCLLRPLKTFPKWRMTFSFSHVSLTFSTFGTT